MPTRRRRFLRRAPAVGALLVIAVFGYWRFLESDAFRSIVERVLARTLAADVTVGSHEVGGLSFRTIILRDLSVEFRAGGIPSGVRFSAKEAEARAERLLGLGAIECVSMSDAEASVRGAASDVGRLDVLRRRRGRAGIGRMTLERMAVSFESGGKSYRVGDMSWTFDFSEGALRAEAGLDVLRIDGLHSPALEREAPSMSLSLLIEGHRIAVRDLDVRGASGWRLAGKLNAVGREDIALDGELMLWNLPVNVIRPPRPGVEISAGARVERTITFKGSPDRLLVRVRTDIKGLTYVDKRLGIKAEGVTLKDMQTSGTFDLPEIIRKLIEPQRSVTNKRR